MQIIHKLGILLAIMLSALVGSAQSKSDKLYDMFSGKDGVTSISFTKSILKPFEIFLDEDTEKVMYKMKKIRFMAYNEDKGDLNANKVYERMLRELDGGAYFEIDPDEIECDDCDIHFESDDDVHLIGHGKRKNMDEFHVVIYDNDNCILFSFYGDITIEDLKECGKFTRTTKDFSEF